MAINFLFDYLHYGAALMHNAANNGATAGSVRRRQARIDLLC